MAIDETELKTTELIMKDLSFGVVFDIDGVLMRDGIIIPNATQALKLLEDKETGEPKYPYIFMTNNGGFTEEEKAKKISIVLEQEIPGDKVMVAHTPVKPLAEKYKDSDVLLISKTHETSKKLADWYGFKNYKSFQQYIEERPFLCPSKYSKFWTTGVAGEYDIKKEKTSEPLPIKSIILLEEPNDWGECIQVVSDILQSKDGLLKKNHIDLSEEQIIDLHVCNPDFTYGGEFLLPRYTMGALLECIKLLFKTQTGRDLIYTLYGKPYPLTYQYGKQLISDQISKLGFQNASIPKHIYAIGDNPYSDIKGANNLEHEGWISILVKTGCFKGDGNHPEIPAKYVVDNVYDAIKLILKLEGQ
ncbi:hypothetical protein RB653_001327 [Dictyostelium firmibasis]|uniref:Uncharacterized protein n=1 Tax=Dictyostelium firmibasis TaxID=79012 RepID=A0AAN7YV56_9MYCE